MVAFSSNTVPSERDIYTLPSQRLEEIPLILDFHPLHSRPGHLDKSVPQSAINLELEAIYVRHESPGSRSSQ